MRRCRRHGIHVRFSLLTGGLESSLATRSRCDGPRLLSHMGDSCRHCRRHFERSEVNQSNSGAAIVMESMSDPHCCQVDWNHRWQEEADLMVRDCWMSWWHWATAANAGRCELEGLDCWCWEGRSLRASRNTSSKPLDNHPGFFQCPIHKDADSWLLLPH